MLYLYCEEVSNLAYLICMIVLDFVLVDIHVHINTHAYTRTMRETHKCRFGISVVIIELAKCEVQIKYYQLAKSKEVNIRLTNHSFLALQS